MELRDLVVTLRPHIPDPHPPPTPATSSTLLSSVTLLRGYRIGSCRGHVTRPLNQNKPEQVLHCFPAAGASASPRNSSFVQTHEYGAFYCV